MEAAERAEDLLKDNIDTMHRMAEALLEFEVLDDPQLDKLMRGEKLERPVPEENGRASEPEESESAESAESASGDSDDETPEAPAS